MTWDRNNVFTSHIYDGYSRVDDARGLFQIQPPQLRPSVEYALKDALATLRVLSGQSLTEPEPDTPRIRLARHAGIAAWRIGFTISQLGRFIEDAGDSIINAGDSLADWIADR